MGYIPSYVSPRCLIGITEQPESQTIAEGGNTTFSIVAVNYAAATLTYRWQVSTDSGVTWAPLSDGGEYSGASTDELAITAANLGLDGYDFRCMVSSNICDVPSNAAELTVTPAAVCPPVNRMLLPPMTESSGIWYADLTEAQNVLSGDWVESCNGESCGERIVVGCIAYGSYGAPDPDPTISRDFSASGSSSLSVGMSRSIPNASNNNAVYASMQLEAGSVLSVGWSMSVAFPGPDDGQIDVFASLFDSSGNTVQSLTTSSTGASPVSGSGTFVFDPLVSGGRYIIVLEAVGSGATGGNAVVSTFNVTSDDTMTVLPITALYHGDSSPSCLSCVP